MCGSPTPATSSRSWTPVCWSWPGKRCCTAKRSLCMWQCAGWVEHPNWCHAASCRSVNGAAGPFSEMNAACFRKAVPARCLLGKSAQLTRESSIVVITLPGNCFCQVLVVLHLQCAAVPSSCGCTIRPLQPAPDGAGKSTADMLHQPAIGCCTLLLCLQTAALAGHPPPHHEETCTLPERAQLQ